MVTRAAAGAAEISNPEFKTSNSKWLAAGARLHDSESLINKLRQYGTLLALAFAILPSYWGDNPRSAPPPPGIRRIDILTVTP